MEEQKLLNEEPQPVSTSEGQVSHTIKGQSKPEVSVATGSGVERVLLGTSAHGWLEDSFHEAIQFPQAAHDFRLQPGDLCPS